MLFLTVKEAHVAIHVHEQSVHLQQSSSFQIFHIPPLILKENEAINIILGIEKVHNYTSYYCIVTLNM